MTDQRSPTGDADAAPGWEAITAELSRLHPGQGDPPHWSTDVRARAQFGGPELVDGISAYAASTPLPHWHLVTYGLTELYFKEEDSDAAHSGWGFELTVRAPRDGDAPPAWAPELLRAVARHLADTALRPPVGSWFRAGRPLGDLDSDIAGFLFADDPDLPAIDTAHGQVAFLQIVGLLEDELTWCDDHSGQAFLDGPGRALPQLITAPHRHSLLAP